MKMGKERKFSFKDEANIRKSIGNILGLMGKYQMALKTLNELLGKINGNK